MARLGRGQPNRPIILRANPRPDLWVLSGTAPTSSSAAGALGVVQHFAGNAPASSGAPGRLGLIIAFAGKAPASSDAPGSLTVLEADLEAMARAELIAATTRVLRRVDLYEFDGETLIAEGIDTLDWSVSVSDGKGARRTITASLSGDDGALLPSDTGANFDKVLKVYRGVVLTEREDAPYYWPVGVFDIEPIRTRRLPADVVAIGGQDFAGRVNRSSLDELRVFAAGRSVESVVTELATYAGITRFRCEDTGRVLTRDFTVETDTYLWDAIERVCEDNGCEAYFDAAGYLFVGIVRYADERPIEYAFAPGAGGNLVDFEQERSRSLIFNHWRVRGESSDAGSVPVHASVENDEPTSPVSVSRIGRQSAPAYVSAALVTEDDCRVVAEAFRARGGIRARTAKITGPVAPWLDAGSVVTVEDPNPAPEDDPVARWQLTAFTVSSELGPTDYDANRVDYVGART